jgi:hypothetical protein
MTAQPLGARAALEQSLAARAPRILPFRSLAAAERERHLRCYLEHLRRRDGEIDWQRWRLPRRDAVVEALRDETISWRGRLDRDAFYQFVHGVGAPDTDLRTLWASFLAMANEGERFGVIGETKKLRRLGPAADPIQVYHVLQEDAHNRILLEALRCVGLEGVRWSRPRALYQWLIWPMAWFPDALRYVLVLVGEALGCVVLQRLVEWCHLFADGTGTDEYLRTLLTNILYDERLHVVHCRARLGPTGVAVAGALAPVSARVVEATWPQIRRLGLDRGAVAQGLREGIEIPADVRWVPDDRPVGRTGL